MGSLKRLSSYYKSGFSFPLILARQISQTPWELYQKVFSKNPNSFFLDSQLRQQGAQRYSYFGWDPALKISLGHQRLQIEGRSFTAQKSGPILEVMKDLFRQVKVAPGFSKDYFTGGAVGYLGYELAGELEKVMFRAKKGPAFPKLQLLIARDLVVFDHEKNTYQLISWVIPRTGISFDEACRRANAKIDEMRKILFSGQENGKEQDFDLLNFKPEISQSAFEKMVRKAKAYIKAGDIYQANLSQRFSFQFEGSALKLYGRLRETNPAPYSAFLHFDDLMIASSSPELLVEKKGTECVTCPIAGTRPRGREEGETQRLGRELLASEKERAEHLMLVDLERNDLGRVSKWRSVKVKDFMRIEKYARVQHIVSEITSRMRPAKDAWDLIQAMFPGGTITGCPKIRSMEIIDELEPVQRGIYTGSLGYVGFDGNLKLNIAIRTLVLLRNQGYLQVGAGIVADSDPEKEYQETLHKGEALAEALISIITKAK